MLAKESTAWIERNVRPWYYYWLFFAESGIWALFLLTGLCWPWLKKKVRMRKEYTFAVLWTVVTLVMRSDVYKRQTQGCDWECNQVRICESEQPTEDEIYFIGQPRELSLIHI